MRHRKRGRKLNRTTAHRAALKRTLTNSLFKSEKNRIVTTVPKAKETRPFAEKLITLAKTKSLHRYRRALSILADETSVNKLFNEIAPRYAGRPGGYARIIKWPTNRLGDNAPQAILELVGADETEASTKKTRRRGRKVSVRRKAKPRTAAEAVEPAGGTEAPEAAGEDGEAEEETGAGKEQP